MDDNLEKIEIIYRFVLPEQTYEYNIFKKSNQMLETLLEIENICMQNHPNKTANELALDIRETIGFLIYALYP